MRDEWKINQLLEEKSNRISRQAIHLNSSDKNNVDFILTKYERMTDKHVLDTELREQIRNESIIQVDKQK